MDEIELDNISWDYLITEGTNIKIKIWYLASGNYLKSKIVIKSISVDCNTFWYYTIGAVIWSMSIKIKSQRQ